MNLFEALFEKKKFIPGKKKIAIQLLESLDYIHQIGFVHLDLKSKNIMFETSTFKNIILLDFGISKLFKQNQLT